MHLRLAIAADIPAVFKVRTSVHDNHMSMEELADIGVTPDTLPAMLEGDGRGWVAQEGGEVRAFAMANAAEATIFALFVQPGHDGRGVGRRLMHEAEQWLFSRGCAEIWLVTDRNRAVRANGFYRHLGWRDDGVQDDGQVLFTKRRGQRSTAPEA